MQPVVDPKVQLESIEADEQLGLLDLPRITAQQRVYVAGRVSGLGVRAAAEQAGASHTSGQRWERDEVVQAYMDHYHREMTTHSLPRVRFGVEDAHAMYMKAYHMSATAGEMVKATDSLVKLHKLNDDKPKELPSSVNAKQLADLPLSELMRLAGLRVESLQPGAIDGEFTEVDE